MENKFTPYQAVVRLWYPAKKPLKHLRTDLSFKKSAISQKFELPPSFFQANSFQ